MDLRSLPIYNIDAVQRELADAHKRIAKLEATVERILAEPRRSTPSELVNQTIPRKERPPHYSQGDPLGR